jgi:hypothetical protein
MAQPLQGEAIQKIRSRVQIHMWRPGTFTEEQQNHPMYQCKWSGIDVCAFGPE